jgi:hypothetical protein
MNGEPTPLPSLRQAIYTRTTNSQSMPTSVDPRRAQSASLLAEAQLALCRHAFQIILSSLQSSRAPEEATQLYRKMGFQKSKDTPHFRPMSRVRQVGELPTTEKRQVTFVHRRLRSPLEGSTMQKVRVLTMPCQVDGRPVNKCLLLPLSIHSEY